MTLRVKLFAEKLILNFETQLSKEHVAILMQHDVAGRGYLAIATDLGVSVGTVKSRLHRARQSLNLLRARATHPNGKPKFAEDGTMLDERGNRSIFDDVDQ